MKIRKKVMMFLTMFCLVSVGVLSSSNTVYAKKITSMSQAEAMALKKVKNAVVTELDKDYEKGRIVYEVKLVKGTKEYEITYRASDGKMISYSWEENKIDKTSTKKIMSKSKIKKLAKKKVKGASIVSVEKKRDDGIYVYKVKMKKNNTKYSLEYHARTGKLLEYERELVEKSTKNGNSYIGCKKAKQIALKKVPGATVMSVEFEKDDGVPVYEVFMSKKKTSYDIEIHAVTGKILNVEKMRMEYSYD